MIIYYDQKTKKADSQSKKTMYVGDYVNWLKKITDNIQISPLGAIGDKYIFRIRMIKNKEYFGYHDITLSGSETDSLMDMLPEPKKDGTTTTKKIKE